MSNEIILYNHGGSGNHGCEAIVRSIVKMLRREVILISYRPHEDMHYKLNDIGVKVDAVKYPYKWNMERVYLFFMRRVLKNSKPDYKYQFQDILKRKDEIIISIGGDLYCGKNTERLTYLNKKISRNNKSVLLGCSIDPLKLKDPEIVEDMKKYTLISARETITYNALKKAGITENVIICADPAFVLDACQCELPESFVEGKTIGINISPLICSYEKESGIIECAYSNMMNYIIEKTDYHIALIPHVIWSGVSDLHILQKLYDCFKDSNRVSIVKDCNCMNLKWIISRCEMFIGARTHSTIAAYSSMIPTVVVGYSVKAQGIAKDLFGTINNYVISADSITNGEELIDAFKWLNENKKSIKAHLEKIMPEYKKTSTLVVDKIKEMIKND